MSDLVKTCTKCGKELPATLEFFHRHKQSLYPSCKECVKRRVQARQKNDPEGAYAKNRRWEERNPERVKENRRKKEKRRDERKRNAKGTHTKRDIQKQYESQRGRCWWCFCELNGEYHIDHIVAIARGGSNGPENLVISCPKCNCSKIDKLPHEWIDRLL